MKLTKKLFIAIMTMALLVVTFTTSTFAWFTLGNTADIQNVQVNVTTGTGMEISRDGTSWKNRIELTNPTGLDFTAVTSFDGINFYDTLDGALTNTAANVKYYEQSFYVRVTKTTGNEAGFDGISLIEATGDAQTFTTDADKWLCDVSLGTTSTGENPTFTATDYVSGRDSNDTIVEGQYREFDALNAVKVSFTPVVANATAKVYAFENNTNAWGSVPAISEQTINSGLAYDYAYAKSYDMSRAQPSVANASAFPTYITDADITAANAINLTSESTQEQQNAKAKTYILVKSQFVTATAAKAENGILADVQGNLDDGYMYAKVTIRIWIEGWDADCINAILGDHTVLSFKLKAN